MKEENIVICGAGIAGVACAYYLSQQCNKAKIILVDKLTPLSFTTSQSGENFREYWPQPSMNQFVRHSIKLMETLQQTYPDEFQMKYFGYDFISHNRGSEIFPSDPNLDDGVFTTLNNPDEIQRQKPYLDTGIEQVVHINQGGGIDVYGLGSLMLKLTRKNGVKLIQAEITDLSKSADNYVIELDSNRTISAQYLILSAGPFTPNLAQLLEFELPIYSIPQRKFVIPDPNNVIPRGMPFTIYADKQKLNWTDEELELIGKDEQFSHLLNEYPAGLHIKPEGHSQIKMGWAFNTTAEDPKWEVETNPDFPDIVMRGATRFIPGLSAYINNIPTPVVQFAGYYTRTKDNLPLIGQLDSNLFVVSALAGYGTMSACAAGSLCTAYLTQSNLPKYARYFVPDRFKDVELMNEINLIKGDGQL